MRINLEGVKGVFLAHGSTDMRLSMDGLAARVQETFELDPFSSNLFIFCNRQQDRIKILHWDHNGFWLYYRRLENGTFNWPQGPEDETMQITPRQLIWLLEGLTLEDGRVFPKMNVKKVV
ncbi:IS66 family insertion sequence element accessory protein TnpB [Sporosarcina saromensis]|uniref:IS66 family insertion sequence element accessory protein TnpB n=2 Tax=Sporosarcina TaxID=1569 RepID=A0ABU4GG93_9BACL|nr:IS66 family insertion sequence element accessory protein TnpB [Sporosarcina saromensis]MDW0115315.1 IS66 family insertion sequence element accessory protein TnpB [Sporosarcina saromensis]